MIQKMRRAQNCAITTNSHYKILISQMLTIELDAIDTRKLYIVVIEDAE